MKRGFSMLEMLIVVLVLGFLAAIVIPQFNVRPDTTQPAATQAATQPAKVTE